MSNLNSGIRSLFTKVGNKVYANVTVTDIEGLSEARNIEGIDFDGRNDVVYFAICDTTASTVKKSISLNNFKLVSGAKVRIKFTNGNTANNPTIEVNSTGAKNIKIGNSNIPNSFISSNLVYTFIYDGSAWQVNNPLTSGIDNIPYVIYNGTLSPLELHAVMR